MLFYAKMADIGFYCFSACNRQLSCHYLPNDFAVSYVQRCLSVTIVLPGTDKKKAPEIRSCKIFQVQELTFFSFPCAFRSDS